MSTFVRARSNSESAPVAVILPGAGYTAMGPLLYRRVEMLAQEGWHVQGVEWTVDARALSDPKAFVEQAVAEAFNAAPQSSRRLIVAKSLGCFALPWARRNGIPGVWLTPMLTNEDVRLALIEASAADMAVGGDADAVWLPEAIADTRATVISVPKADHSLAIPGDWLGSLTAQTAVFESIANHVGTASERHPFTCSEPTPEPTADPPVADGIPTPGATEPAPEPSPQHMDDLTGQAAQDQSCAAASTG